MNESAALESSKSWTRNRKSVAPDLALLTTTVLWATTFIVTKNAFDQMPAMAFVFVRFLLMSGFAFAVLLVLRQRSAAGPFRPVRSDFGRFAIAGLAGFTIYQLGFNLGLDRTSVFSASLLISTSPLFTILILSLIGERPPWTAWLGMLISVVGVAVFLLDKQGGERSYAGDALCIMAAIAFALYGIVNRPLVRSYPPATYTAYTVLFGSVPLLLAGLPAAMNQDWTALPGRIWLSIIYMVIFPVYIAYMLWNFGIARRGATIATSFGLLVPVLSGVLSAIVFDESFGPGKIAGAALVLTGLIVIRIGLAR